MNPERTVLLAGASGLLGRALASRLQAEGWEVRRLVRRPAAAPGEFSWDPARGEVPAAAFDHNRATPSGRGPINACSP
ncbi:MAG: NAD-dependent epimerase/dehydratase family protein, partial [Verrucomicrobiota bacterium]